jgi:hypothetical protein
LDGNAKRIDDQFVLRTAQRQQPLLDEAGGADDRIGLVQGPPDPASVFRILEGVINVGTVGGDQHRDRRLPPEIEEPDRVPQKMNVRESYVMGPEDEPEEPDPVSQADDFMFSLSAGQNPSREKNRPEPPERLGMPREPGLPGPDESSADNGDRALGGAPSRQPRRRP